MVLAQEIFIYLTYRVLGCVWAPLSCRSSGHLLPLQRRDWALHKFLSTFSLGSTASPWTEDSMSTWWNQHLVTVPGADSSGDLNGRAHQWASVWVNGASVHLDRKGLKAVTGPSEVWPGHSSELWNRYTDETQMPEPQMHRASLYFPLLTLDK